MSRLPDVPMSRCPDLAVIAPIRAGSVASGQARIRRLSSLPELRIGPVRHGAVKVAAHRQVSVVSFLHPAIVGLKSAWVACKIAGHCRCTSSPGLDGFKHTLPADLIERKGRVACTG